MGREIRRVPPNWDHPRYTQDNAHGHKIGSYIPLRDKEFETVADEWLAQCIAWSKGEHKDQIDDPTLIKKYPYFWEWHGGPPTRESYRPKFTEEPTWYQIYETVSEGTPASPPFATKEELATYLSTHGDFAYQEGYREISPKPPTYERAMKFIEQGFVLSGTFSPASGFKSTYDTVKD